jgi:hypothetical protein
MGSRLRKDFLESEEGQDIRQIFQNMTQDTLYNTAASYSANSERYPDNSIPFTDKHMEYLNSHPNLDAGKYIANIKLMTRVRH